MLDSSLMHFPKEYVNSEANTVVLHAMHVTYLYSAVKNAYYWG